LIKRVPAQDSETGQAYQVKIMDGKVQAERVIQIGLMDRVMAEVKSGLKAGDQVVIPAAQVKPQTQQGMGRMGGPRL
jgi:macrolide-specific efflux system membrane fusion protein